MKISKTLYTLLLLLLLTNGSLLQAQGVFPVAVSGNGLTPPNTMILSEYGTVRANNISFTVTLNDPIEASRDVYFRISVRNNGKEIMRSKANFKGTPMTLTQYTPIVLTGNELTDYFKPENLRGSNPNASNLLPEGFNQICLEVVDLQREVVISNEGCVGAFFQLYDPPMLELPACHGELMMPIRGASTLFKWLPRHIGLPGAPNMVEYILEIVELTPGIGNPNDAFNRAWKIGVRNTMSNSWLWLETDPPLEVGKRYGWRVQVVDLTGSQGAFKNKGYSEVCTFEVKRKIVPRYTITECHPASTEYPVAPTYGPESTNLKVGETVYLGYFDLKITEVDNPYGNYYGKGEIYVPFLKCNIPVKFEGLKVNEDNYVYEIGGAAGSYAEAESDDQFRTFFGPSRDPVTVSWLRKNRGGKNGKPVGLSIALDKILNKKDTVLIYFAYMHFTTRNAQARCGADINGMSFENSQVYFGPSGPQQGNELELSQYGNKDYLNELDPHLHLNYRQSVIKWDCKGAKNIEMKAYYEFEHRQGYPKSQSLAGEPGLPINGTALATFTLPYVGADDFILKPDKMDTLVMHDPLPLVVVHKNILFDFSLTDSIKRMKYPDHYTNDSLGVKWRGFVYNSGKIAFPEKWDLTQGKGLTMSSKAFIVDSLATYGAQQEKRRILDLNVGRVGDWRLRVDSMNVVVNETLVDTFNFRGQTGPKVSRPTVPYYGLWSKDGVNTGAPIAASPPYYYLNVHDTLRLPLWHSYLALDSVRSHIIGQPGFDATTGTYALEGKSDLFGQFNITPTMRDVDANPDNQPAIDSLNAKVVPLGDYDISSMNLYVEHFKIDHPDNPQDKAFYAQTYNAGSIYNIGNADLKTDLMVLPERDSIEIRNTFQKAIGVHLSDENFPMQVRVWGIDPNKDGFFTFGQVELIPEPLLGPDQPFLCDCNPSPPAIICAPEAPTNTAPSAISIDDVIDIGGFKMVIENPGFAKLRIPFMKTTVSVTTSSDLTANSDGVALSGSATTIYNQSLTEGTDDLMAVNFTDNVINAILANKGKEQLPLPAGEQIIESANDIGETIDVPKEFCLTRMHFMPTIAKSDGILMKRLSNGKYLIFKGSDFDTRINGFNFPSIPFYLLKSVTL